MAHDNELFGLRTLNSSLHKTKACFKQSVEISDSQMCSANFNFFEVKQRLFDCLSLLFRHPRPKS